MAISNVRRIIAGSTLPFGISALSWLCYGLLVAPMLALAFSVFDIDPLIWHHLIEFTLTEMVFNSFVLALVVALGAAFVGTLCALVTSFYRFPGKSLIELLLVLPLAMPAYITAYTYTGMFDANNGVAAWLASWGLTLPDIRNLGGSAAVLIAVLYPYVYMLVRASLLSLPQSFVEVSQLSGQSARHFYSRVIFPVIRPAVLMGSLLVMMETLADYGTVAYFGVNTLTTGVFKVWFGMGEINTAMQLSFGLLVLIFFLVYLERLTRRAQQAYQIQASRRLQPRPLSLPASGVVLLLLILPIAVGFLIPVTQLSFWAVSSINTMEDGADYAHLVWNSFSLAFAAAIITVGLAFFFTLRHRFKQSLRHQRSKEAVSAFQIQTLKLGYALPGLVIAVTLMTPLGVADRLLNRLADDWFDYQLGLFFSGTLFALLLAYAIRFVSLAIQYGEDGLSRVSQSMIEVAQLQGLSRWQMTRDIMLPILRPSVLSAMLIVFVDVLKELPATLVLRPFNYNTLAVRTFELASDERLLEAALPAITIVIAGLIPVVLLMRSLAYEREVHG